jgi:alpha-galactosidase
MVGSGIGRLITCFLLGVAGVVSATAVPAASRAALLAPTPYMGWNTYYGVGGHFDETTIKSVANALISTGLAQAGYRIVWLDFGWASGARDSSGNLIVDPTQWPDGMAGLTAWLHQHGLQAGIYTDAGRSGCNGQGVGSYGHYQQDADTFAAWGFDAVKVDFCGAGQEGFTPQPLYADFANAIRNNSSQRPLLLNVDNFWVPGQIDGTNPSLANSSWANYQWAPQVAQSWRTDTDIGFTRNVVFNNVLRNLDHDAAHPEAAGVGHWNDPDYLGPELGMSGTEAKSQFSMWAILAAPLILGSDPRVLSSETIGMLENENVIAVDQDPLGAQGTLVQQAGSAQVWAKPLANGDSAVALLNRGTGPLQISTTAASVGLPAASGYQLQDLWTNTTTTTGAEGEFTALVPGHGVTLYRVSSSPGSGSSDPPGTAALTVTTIGLDNGTVRDNSGMISCPSACSAHYPLGSAATLSATPVSGATFEGWHAGGCSGIGGCTITLTADTRVTASFLSPVHTLSVSLAGAGSVTDASGAISCAGTCSAPYSDRSRITLTATPSPGWAFAGWSGGGCSSTGACTVTLGGDTTVRASFVPAHTLTVSVIGAGVGRITGTGISCPGSCSASYAAGTSVTLAATPAAESRFGAWLNGGCPAAGTSCTVTLSQDVTATVAFDLPTTGTAYVVNTGSNTVTPVDLATDTVGRPISGFDRPGNIAIAPDGGTAYVVDSGGGMVTPINLATNRTEPAITGFVHPGPIAISPDGKSAYVLEDNRRLVPVDLATDQSEPAITFARRSGLGKYAGSIAISPNGKTAYLGTFTLAGRTVSGTLAAVDLANGKLRAVVHGFADPTAIAITPHGKIAYVADAARSNVTPINLATQHPIRAPALTARGAFPGAHDVGITPDGKIVYVANNRGRPGSGQHRDGVGLIDTTTNTPVVIGLTGIASASGVAIAPNGGTAYLTSSPNDSVVPVDVATNTERPALTGFSSPSAIAITVPPPPRDSARLSAQPTSGGDTVSDTVTCSSPTTSCTTIQTLTNTDTVGTQSDMPVSARSQRDRFRRIIMVIGTKTVTIQPGRTIRVSIRLNPIGRQLLNRFGTLPVLLGLAIRRTGHTDTLTTHRLTIKLGGGGQRKH